jgi:hypothetical protein
MSGSRRPRGLYPLVHLFAAARGVIPSGTRQHHQSPSVRPQTASGSRTATYVSAMARELHPAAHAGAVETGHNRDGHSLLDPLHVLQIAFGRRPPVLLLPGEIRD